LSFGLEILYNRQKIILGGIFMKIRWFIVVVFILTVLGLYAVGESKEVGWQVSGKKGVVVAGPEGSAKAGLEILVKGGNAADAAVATILALSVVDSGGFCFGGEVPILIYEAERGVVDSISGMGVAPALATREYFQKAGGIKGRTSASAAVPAVLDACLVLLDRYGTMKFADVTEPVLRILDRNEKTWHSNLAATLRRLIQVEKRAKDRKRGLRLVSDYFYRGPIAREIDTWSRANSGLIRYSDLATHITRVEEPVKATYRGYTVCKCNTWTQGPYLLQALKLLEGFDFKLMDFQTPDTIHAIVESMKLAMADRDAYYGDPLFEDVPLQQLLSSEYSRMRRELINMHRASMTQQPGDPLVGKPLRNEKVTGKDTNISSSDTTTCLVADRFGNVVAATPSGWGGVLAGNTGVWLGSRLISFNTWKGHPNCIQPGKRPRITLTPTIVLKDGKPVLAVSIAGGDTQDQATLQIVTNYIDFGLSPDKLITTPRYATHHYVGSFSQTPPILGGLTISTRMGKEIIRKLKARGHIINPNSSTGHVAQLRTVVVIGTKSGVLHGAGDPEATPKRTAAAF
jgi:gamma-glutamyltranspeptidase/glutathione hydrolase